MNLNKTELDELNILLKDKQINLPEFRRSISPAGQNADWLKKKIGLKNPTLPQRVKDLINKI